MQGLATVREVKRRLDGRRDVFLCQALALGRQRTVVRFVSSQGGSAGGITFPPGTTTYGFFWRRRPYNLYRLVDPQGRLLAHRFDVVDEVRIRPQRGEVEYLDLLLDIWVYPDGHLRLEDEAEVADHVRRGLLSPRQRARIARTQNYLLRAWGRIIGDSRALLVALGLDDRVLGL